MRGRIQSIGDRFRSLQRSNSQHMQSVPPLVTTDDSEASSLRSASGDSFFQDGRQISVGDCALFKPPQDSPPFIGLICWLKAEKQSNLKLGVNRLYRSAEVNLGEGFSVETAPNEVFYSFHTDEIPAASLLHPCKVAFLPKGLQLPTGASSFVCRRVYDNARKCLRWLSDHDFIDGRQEEVDKLLHKTRTEMHAMLHSGGRSPKQANGPSSGTQLKPATDSGQNSGNSLNSQVRGQKREREDHNSEPIKRERSSKADDADSLQCKVENKLKSEISLITEEGGVVNSEGVDKLIQLMQLVSSERKMDPSCCSMLAGVMAATDKVDCLNRFMQLGGLPILDEWLQDVRRGRVKERSNSKNRDKSVEKFLLVLLRALDKLPVNLQALETCNIGKSVNHLRSHKNLEIQRKARALVGTWKKRVEAEMISNDAKPGPPEAFQGGGGGVRTPSGSDVSIKNSSTQNSASKMVSSRSSHGDDNVKSASSPPGTGKQASPPSIGPRNSPGDTEDVPQVKEERGNEGYHLHNCSPSYSVKDDKKSTTHKMSSSGSQSKKTGGTYHGISSKTSHKEANSNRSSSSKKVAFSDKRAHSSLSSERIAERAASEGTHHKIIVKIPNRVRSPPPQCSTLAMADDSTYVCSRVSSPLLPEKNEPDVKMDSHRWGESSDMKMDSHQDCDLKDGSVGSADGAGPRGDAPDEGHSVAAGDSKRAVCSLTSQYNKPLESHSSSLSPINALIESCIKYSEADTSPSLDDNGGINLLASVATGEMSRSDLVPIVDSSEMKKPAAEEDRVGGDVGESKSSPEDAANVDQSPPRNDDVESDGLLKKYVATGGLQCEDSSNLSKHAQQLSTDRRSGISLASEDVPSEISSREMMSNSDGAKFAATERSKEISGTDSLLVPSAKKPIESGPDEKMIEEKSTFSNAIADHKSNCKSGAFDDLEADERVASVDEKAKEVKPFRKTASSVQSVGEEGCAATAADVSPHAAETSHMDGKMKFDLNEGLGADEVKSRYPVNLTSLTYPANSSHRVRSSPITVASAAKGPFVPPEDLLRSKEELGWKGSAATSAFRPAEPRRAPPEAPQASTSNKPAHRLPLDIDLNVPDEGILEEMASADFSLALDSTTDRGGLDLDLNAIDGTNDNCNRADVWRGFDLNDGPGADDGGGGGELFLFSRQGGSGGVPPPPHQPSSSGLRMNAPPVLGSFSSSWIPAGNVYAPVAAVPSVLQPDQSGHHFLGPRPFAPSGPGPFTPEAYHRGSVLSSSPAVNFPSGPFPFPVFPFGTSFPAVPSSAPPAGPRMYAPPPPLHHQQLSHFPSHYVVSLPESSGRSGLDLNAGPGAAEEMFSLAAAAAGGGQQSAGGSRALTEEQAKIYSASNGGGVLKRREPEGGGGFDRFKHNSWQ